MKFKIISGGQTGADQGGLEAARELGLETGGFAPKSWTTEDGPQEVLLTGYGLVECSVNGYPARTRLNAINSDATIVFGNVNSRGTSLTVTLCSKMHKPCLINPSKSDLIQFIKTTKPVVLNIAGNRESKNSGIQKKVREFLIESLKELNNAART